jgi:hypothetical protein
MQEYTDEDWQCSSGNQQARQVIDGQFAMKPLHLPLSSACLPASLVQ